MKFRARVIKGSGRGAQLGFPTLNLASHGAPRFSTGIYACKAALDGRRYSAALFFGPREMFGESVPSLEVHLIDVKREAGDEGKTVEVTLGTRIRDVKVFATKKELIEAIRGDIEKIKALI